jgi:TonB-linked SusC/RagA family outer membrane protein
MKAKILRRFLFLLSACLLGQLAHAQSATLQGQVVSGKENEPLIGVTVLVKDKNQGAQTDLQGRFSVQAQPGDVLVFRYTGFDAQEFTIKDAAGPILVSLQPASKVLGEVVVVGYGKQSRETLTSAVTKLDTEVLASAPRANIGSALQGAVSGVQVVNSTGQPGAAPVILLRGGASINNPGAPLVIVDGVVRSLNDIASEDIASIELLKDAASTAIYGARANNGVILITTKQGKAGTAQISYKFTGGYNQRRAGYTYLGARDYIYYTRLGYLNAGRTLAQANASRGLGLLTDAANLASFDIRKLDNSSRGLLAEGWQVMADPYKPAVDSIIFKDHGGEIEELVFRNTYTRDHYLSAVGGNDKGKYFASFNYFDEDGVIVGSNYKRYSGVLNGSYRLRPNVEVSTGVTLSTSSQIGVLAGEANALYRSLAIWPTFNPWLDAAKTQPNPGNGASDGNPLYWLGRAQRDNEVNRITVNGGLNWEILPGFLF